MIYIQKKPEPDFLMELREKAKEQGKTGRRAFELLNRNKLRYQSVKETLMDEQGHLCAYCMCEIPRSDVSANSKIPSTSIEHYIPCVPGDGKELDYTNLFLVCHGNKAEKGIHSEHDLTCDVHKGNKRLKKVNPTIKETLQTIKYKSDGTIDADDPEVKYDLNEILNLNSPTASLVGEREAVIRALADEVNSLHDENEILDFCDRVLHDYQTSTSHKLPYTGVAIYYLEGIIQSHSSKQKHQGA